MQKTDLIIYRDRIKKLHKAALAFEEAHSKLEEHQEKMLNNSSEMYSDWEKLSNYMKDNPDLSNMINEVEDILNRIAD